MRAKIQSITFLSQLSYNPGIPLCNLQRNEKRDRLWMAGYICGQLIISDRSSFLFILQVRYVSAAVDRPRQTAPMYVLGVNGVGLGFRGNSANWY